MQNPSPVSYIFRESFSHAIAQHLYTPQQTIFFIILFALDESVDKADSTFLTFQTLIRIKKTLSTTDPIDWKDSSSQWCVFPPYCTEHHAQLHVGTCFYVLLIEPACVSK